MSSKIHNNTSKGLIHYFSKNTVDFRQRKNFETQKNLLLNDDVINNNDDFIIISPKILRT